MYHHYLEPLLHLTYRLQGKIYNRFTSKHLSLLCIFLFTLLHIIYPSQAASDNPANKFINNLFNSSGMWMWMCWNCDFKQCDVVYGWIWMLMSMFLMNIVIVYGFACWCEWMCWIWMRIWIWINCIYGFTGFIIPVVLVVLCLCKKN
jgi:hypothetical protein